MTIGFNTLFAQRDVRITPTSTATATAVGLTDPLYVCLSTDADLTNERVLTAGEGVDFTDNGAGGTLVIAGENATTANKGIASFNTNDFTVAAGAVSLKNKTSYWSCNGVAFTAINPATDVMIHSPLTGATDLTAVGDDPEMFASVNLPNGAVVTGVIVYGSDATNTFDLRRTTMTDKTTSDMATANVNTEDTSITNATIDNSLYCYWLQLTAGLNDEVYGARIKYTTDYD